MALRELEPPRVPGPPLPAEAGHASPYCLQFHSQNWMPPFPVRVPARFQEENLKAKDGILRLLQSLGGAQRTFVGGAPKCVRPMESKMGVRDLVTT